MKSALLVNIFFSREKDLKGKQIIYRLGSPVNIFAKPSNQTVAFGRTAWGNIYVLESDKTHVALRIGQ